MFYYINKMTDKFIQAWCEEHGFSNKVAALIAYLEIEEKDLNVDNYSENIEEIVINDETYTVFDESDIKDQINCEIDDRENEIKRLLDRSVNIYLPMDISDYINWDEYFDDSNINVWDVIDDTDFTEFCFNNQYFYIHVGQY